MPPLLQPPSDAAGEHASRILRLQGLSVGSSRRAWRSVDPQWISESWRAALGDLAQVISAAQVAAADSGAAYGAAVLAEQGQYVAPEAFVRPTGFGGYAADGRDLADLLYSPATTAKSLIGAGADPSAALASARGSLDRIVQSTIADAARQAASVDIAARPQVGYVRMLVGRSCPNCVILAGRYYRWNAGFLRHPHDDCVHVPATQASSAGLVTDPYEHFKAMSSAEQDQFWGAGDAQAIRDGADLYRVANARRGAQGMTTLEGTASRARGGGRVGQVSGLGRGAGRGFANGSARLTPDGIYAQATSRDEALALLERHGYILPGGQTPGGSILGSGYEGYGALGRGGTRVGARHAVEAARATGVRGSGLAAEQRMATARLRWDAVRAGRNPESSDGAGLTPQIAARVERSYRRWTKSAGQIVTR